MKIEMVNNNKLKIMFDYTELKENNISLHSFLSNSIESQKFFIAILDIANEDLGFNKDNSKLTYETISFDNKFFIIIVTKNSNTVSTQNSTTFYNSSKTEFLYKLTDINDLFNFCDDLKTVLPSLNFDSLLYEYNNIYFLKIDLKDLKKSEIEKIIFHISEFKNPLDFSELVSKKFYEFAKLIIQHNAIQSLGKKL